MRLGRESGRTEGSISCAGLSGTFVLWFRALLGCFGAEVGIVLRGRLGVLAPIPRVIIESNFQVPS